MPPASRNHRDPTGWDTPPSRAASSLERPAAIASQNRRLSSRFATGGRPGDRIGALNRRSEPRFRFAIAPSFIEALRRPVETALAAVVTMMVYETTGTAMSLRQWHLRDPRLRQYALWQAFLAFGWNYDLLRRWKRSVMTLDPADRAAVDASIERLQDRVQRERHPLPVPASEGWCPERARRFLDDHGLHCGYYDDLHGEWQASSPYREFEGGVIPDNLAYYVVGDGTAARRLTLTLNRNDLDVEAGSEAAFTEAAERLAVRALGAAPGDTILEQPLPLGDGWVVAKRDEWERGCSRRLTLAKRQEYLQLP